MPRTFLFLLVLIAFVLSQGCVSHENLVNFQSNRNVKDLKESILYPPNIRVLPNDVLDIKVYSLDPETVTPFNLNATASMAGVANVETLQLNGYLVDKNGDIDFPILGRISIGGLSLTDVKKEIVEKLDEYIIDPVVNVRLINFKITISGEVNRPGALNVLNDRITLPEAISMGGDFTNYANRANILVIREDGDQRNFHRINMLNGEVFDSEFYFLRQNDLIYVEPLKAKTGSIRDQGNETISFVSAALAMIAVIIGIAK